MKKIACQFISLTAITLLISSAQSGPMMEDEIFFKIDSSLSSNMNQLDTGEQLTTSHTLQTSSLSMNTSSDQARESSTFFNNTAVEVIATDQERLKASIIAASTSSEKTEEKDRRSLQSKNIASVVKIQAATLDDILPKLNKLQGEWKGKSISLKYLKKWIAAHFEDNRRLRASAFESLCGDFNIQEQDHEQKMAFVHELLKISEKTEEGYVSPRIFNSAKAIAENKKQQLECKQALASALAKMRESFPEIAEKIETPVFLTKQLKNDKEKADSLQSSYYEVINLMQKIVNPNGSQSQEVRDQEKILRQEIHQLFFLELKLRITENTEPPLDADFESPLERAKMTQQVIELIPKFLEQIGAVDSNFLGWNAPPDYTIFRNPERTEAFQQIKRSLSYGRAIKRHQYLRADQLFAELFRSEPQLR